ncbi:MAG: hypothetical protein KF864_08510 [Phycisphaeraceae bacterium]|nr:hypothetical protein [Phycisphaeraceae bacterium]MBX3409050.1 hypothetical protein [Phycisphaeraceae bacterium]
MRLSEIMGGLDLAFFPIIAMALFALIFAGVGARLIFARRRDLDTDRAGSLPLDDGRVVGDLTNGSNAR